MSSIRKEIFTDEDICFICDFINNNVSFIKKYAKRINLKSSNTDLIRIQVHCLLIERKVLKIKNELKCKHEESLNEDSRDNKA